MLRKAVKKYFSGVFIVESSYYWLSIISYYIVDVILSLYYFSISESLTKSKKHEE